MTKLFVIISCFFLISCSFAEFKHDNTIDIEKIKKDWTQSYEEEIGSVLIFRPGNYKEFPPSRFRQVYIFMEDDLCKYYVLAPTDAHYFEDGTWNYDNEKQLLTIYNPSGQMEIKYKVLKLTDTLLELVESDK